MQPDKEEATLGEHSIKTKAQISHKFYPVIPVLALPQRCQNDQTVYSPKLSPVSMSHIEIEKSFSSRQHP